MSKEQDIRDWFAGHEFGEDYDLMGDEQKAICESYAAELLTLIAPTPATDAPEWINRPDSAGDWWQSCKVPTGYIKPKMIWVWEHHDKGLVYSESGNEYTMDEYLADYYPDAKFLKVVYPDWQVLNGTPPRPC